MKKRFFNIVLLFSFFAFSLSADIERQLISQRTKEALARKKSEGMKLGRPKGSLSTHTKLSGKEQQIKELLDKRISYTAIGRILGVHRKTVKAFVESRLLNRDTPAPSSEEGLLLLALNE